MKDKKFKVYVASSWRNPWQQAAVAYLINAGFDVYDFRNPGGGDDNGFHWSDIDPDWKKWDFNRYAEGLRHRLAEDGFGKDFSAMKECDGCLLVNPCGRSAHLELGWFAGAGKPTAIWIPHGERIEPELMYKMSSMYDDLHQVVLAFQDVCP